MSFHPAAEIDFRSALADQFPLDFSGHRKRHRQDFRLQGIVQLPVTFNSNSQRQNLHTFQHRAAELGQPANDEGIDGLQVGKELAELPLAPMDGAVGGFRDPLHAAKLRSLAKCKRIVI